MNTEQIMSLQDRIKLVGKDILATAELTQPHLYKRPQAHIESYQPSKSLLGLMNENEIIAVLHYLQKRHYLSFDPLGNNLAPESSVHAYNLRVDITTFRAYIEPYDFLDFDAVSSSGISFDRVRATLTVNGQEILLGKGLGDRSYQYWVCSLCMKNPNKPVNEVRILDSHSKDLGERARSRAIRDAVYALNSKLKSKAQQTKTLFIYSKGKVTYVEDNFDSSVILSGKM